MMHFLRQRIDPLVTTLTISAALLTTVVLAGLAVIN